MKIEHTVAKWFSDTTFLDYFESDKNLTNVDKTIKVQRTVAKNWDLSVRSEVNKLVSTIAQKVIYAIARWKDMGIKPWELLGEDTKDNLRKAVCAAVRKVTKNREIDERTNASNINLGSISINVDNTNWLNAQDIIGKEAVDLVELSRIDDYDWATEDRLITMRENGIVQAIASADLSVVPDIAQFMEVN